MKHSKYSRSQTLSTRGAEGLEMRLQLKMNDTHIIKASNFTVFEILREFLYYHILHVYTIPTYKVYCFYDAFMITYTHNA